MSKHEWRLRNEEGEQVYYRASLHAGRWTFSSTRKSDPEWYSHEMLPLEIMESFREILWNKYQRRRLPLKHIEWADEIIARLRNEAARGDDEEE